MACKPKPQLRMADGGELMRRFANRQPVRMLNGTPENMAQNTTPMSTQDAGAFAAMGGPQGVAPDAPAAAPAADPGRRERIERKLAAGQRTQTFMPTMGNIQTEAFDPHIRQLVLRDGGTVPGKGTGDKIPALYEPGEFVVSNDMLDAKPGLREQLHDLRGNVLAAKGKSVEQADAEAVSGGTLRAQSGMAPLLGLDPAVANRAAESARQAAFEADTLAKAKLRAETMTQQARSMPPNSGPPNAPPGYRAGQKFTNGLKFASKVAPAVGVAIEAGDVYDVAKDPNTTKIDVGTQAAEGVSKLAGATAGGLAGAAVGGPFAPLTGLVGGIAGYYAPELVTKGLRWATGHDTASPIDRVRAQESAKAATPAAVPVTTPAAAKPVAAPAPAVAPGLQAVTPEDHATSDRLINSALYNRPRTGMIPGGVDQNGLKYGETWDEGNMNTLRTDGSSLKKYNAGLAARGAGIQVTKDANGQLRLSNSTGPEKMRYVGTDGVPTNQYERTNQYTEGQQQLAAARASLRNPDGSTWSARDNAIMAANLRDGVDPYRGTSRAPKEEDRIPAIGEFGHNKALANQTLRRGQDIQSADNRYGHDLSAATARADTRFQMQKDQRDFAVGRYDKGVEQAGKFDEQARSAFKHKFDSIDKDGKLSARPDLEAAAYDEAMRQSNGRWSQLDPAQRAAYLSDAFDHVKLLSSARNHQNNSIWQAVGLANKDAAHGGMPSAADMQGAKLTELGFGSGATTMNAGRGDYKLTLKNGQVMHFGRGDLSQAQLKRLQDLGASLGDK